MVTYNQRLNLHLKYNNSTINSPQVRGRVLKNIVKTPRKPNSARRKVSQLSLINCKIIFAKLRGQGNIPPKFATVLVQGGGFRDTPQVHYTIIRGALECQPLFNKNRRRSIFGTSKQYISAHDKY